MTDDTHPFRRIRSFVRREGRLTPGQARALERWLPEYGLPENDEYLDFAHVFGRQAPTLLEIGFGNGDALLEMAQRHPEWNFIGIEVHRPGVGHLLKEAGELGLKNLRVSSRDAIEVLERQVPDASLERVMLYFPDPWPKKRHHKRRIVQQCFAQLIARKLSPDGEFHLATDWENYAEHMREVLEAAPGFESTSSETYAPRPEDRPLTKFERRGQRLGHNVRDLVYRRT
ncbi:MAG: tRNA (guanosine(46)-N7)-methyltransferase TrmB [Proteobacteria bacterium]|nr:tRNA (guanosine(46)-N7)-methyltransferase TrmB [Pseudomonadota bacterium]